MSTHTPGPWFWEGDSDDGDLRMRIGAGEPDEYGDRAVSVVGGCGCCGSPFGVDAEDELRANARLICAAPDLYEALRNAITWMDTSDPDHETVKRDFERLLSKVNPS